MIFHTFMKEVKAVADAKQIGLPEDIVEASLEKVSKFPYETKSSMQLDFEKGKMTELDTFIGHMVALGAALGVEVPLYQRIYSELGAQGRPGHAMSLRT